MVMIKLPQQFDNCPKPWQNMITHLQNGSNDAVPDRIIQRSLHQFKASLSNNDILVFKDEEYYLLWVLKWT